MRDIEGIDKVIEKLKPHWKEIELRFEKENNQFKSLLTKDHDRLGRVLKCHLIIENYIDRFLTDHYSIDSVEEIKLSFHQKAQLLPAKASAAAFVKPGVIHLNKIRNRYAHQLEYDLDKGDMGPINEVLSVARKGKKFSDPLDALEAFTTVACTWLIVPPKELQSVFMEAFSEVRVNISET